MDFLIESTDVASVGQACFTCNCYNNSCYQAGYIPVCARDLCALQCWGQACNPRQDPISIG